MEYVSRHMALSNINKENLSLERKDLFTFCIIILSYCFIVNTNCLFILLSADCLHVHRPKHNKKSVSYDNDKNLQYQSENAYALYKCGIRFSCSA